MLDKCLLCIFIISRAQPADHFFLLSALQRWRKYLRPSYVMDFFPVSKYHASDIRYDPHPEMVR